MKIAVTGATGYIGNRFVKISQAGGHEIVALCRKNSILIRGAWVPYNLSSNKEPALPIDTELVVHLAIGSSLSEEVGGGQELVAAKLLILAAQKVNALFIFVSSQTARSDAPTEYGRTKWKIEQEVLLAGGRVVRPGQVYGGELRGLFGLLTNLVSKFPLLPMFLPAPMVQPIHVDDLSRGLLCIAERFDLPSGIYCLGACMPISFAAFLNEIAKSRLHRWRGFLPIPALVIKLLTYFLSESLQTRFRLEKLRSLFDLPTMETAIDLNRIGLVLRPLRSGMHRSGNDRRRCLLREGQALLTYVLKEPPSSAVLRRYLRAVELLHCGKELGLPELFLRCPIFLALIDRSAWLDKTMMAEFSWRLDAASLLAEATPFGAYRFLGRELGLPNVMLSIIASILSEVFWRAISVVLTPLVRYTLRRVKAIS